MFLFRYFLLLAFLGTILMASHPEVKELSYKQKLTLMSWKSQEDLESRVEEFCSAA